MTPNILSRAQAIVQGEEKNASMHILIIEDDPSSAYLLQQLLTVSEHEIKVAHSEDEAIKIGIDWDPKLIISDWDLKEGGDGVEACREILKHHKASVIFTSGSAIEQLREAAKALAPLHILTKPIDIENLSALIKKIHEDS